MGTIFIPILQIRKFTLGEVNDMPKFTQLVRKLNQDINTALFGPIAHTPYTEEFDKCNSHYYIPIKEEYRHNNHE